jgi:hypothetical protein
LLQGDQTAVDHALAAADQGRDLTDAQAQQAVERPEMNRSQRFRAHLLAQRGQGDLVVEGLGLEPRADFVEGRQGVALPVISDPLEHRGVDLAPSASLSFEHHASQAFI